MSEELIKVLVALIPVIGAVITYYIIPLIKKKIGTEKLSEIITWVSKAVNCAEQIFAHGDNDKKKNYVVGFIYKMFCSKKEVITRDQIEVLIEAAVREMQK